MNVYDFFRRFSYVLISGMATMGGALPFLFFTHRKLGDRAIDALMGFAAGIMLAISAFSLTVPSIETGGIIRFTVGFFFGGVVASLADRFSPHEHLLKGHEGPDAKRLRGAWLFLITMAIHNLPEGMAVGVSSDTPHAFSVAMAIGFQNIPEGAATIAALVAAKYKKGKAIFLTFLTGVLEILGGLIGIMLTLISQKMLPYLLALAAGAMVYVVSDEVIPETHSKGNEFLATWSILAGFLAMAIFDVALG